MVSFIDCINIVSEQRDRTTLIENKATYKQMMQGVFQAWQKLDPKYATNIQQEANVYQKSLRRSDRVIWALRWLRLYGLLQLVEKIPLSNDPEAQALLPWAEKALNKALTEMTRGSGLDQETIRFATDEFNTSRFTNLMNHFMAYVDPQGANYISSIESYVFEWQTPDQVVQDLTAFEKTWQENREREMDHAEDFYANAEMIMEFEDGFAWWNLNQEYCDAEGAAMGHCGNNQGRSGSGDQVLSLRQDVMRGETRKQVPFLTFILDEYGNMGEMKGRANEKPAERYHKYIVPLLLSDHVQGIKGGGHDPANNFSINDLESEDRELVLDKKPELGNSSDIYELEGFTDRFKTVFYNDLSKHNISQIHDLTEDEVVLEDLGSFENLDKHFYWKPLELAVEYHGERDQEPESRTDFSDDEIRSYRVSEESALDIFHYLPEEYLQRIADDLGMDGDVTDRRIHTDMALHINSSRYADTLIQGVLTVFHEDNNPRMISDEDWKKYQAILVDTVQSGLQLADAHIVIGKDGDYYIHADLKAFLAQIDDIDNEYGDSQLGYVEHWADYDDYQIKEVWKGLVGGTEEYSYYDKDNIVPRISKIVEKGYEPDFDDEGLDKVDMHQVARWFMKYIDIHEAEDDDETVGLIMEMKRRAGLL